jgi:hypothetical protein
MPIFHILLYNGSFVTWTVVSFTIAKFKPLCHLRKTPSILYIIQSELLHDWRFTAIQFVLATSPLRLTTSIFTQLKICGYSRYVTSCLTRAWVCRLQLLLGLASAVIRPKSKVYYDRRSAGQSVLEQSTHLGQSVSHQALVPRAYYSVGADPQKTPFTLLCWPFPRKCVCVPPVTGCLPIVCFPSNGVVSLFCLLGNVFTETLPSN